MSSRWRLLDSGPAAGEWNMALDQVLTDESAERQLVRQRGGTDPPEPILRFYSWDAPTLSFGRMQKPSPDLLRRCADLGIAAVRRPTGGKAILHHREVTFSIIAPAVGMGSVMDSYRTFARAIAAGLRALGVEARLCQPQPRPRGGGLLCFAAPAQCDLEVGGRKLLGSAQMRRGGVLLQQNSLPLVLSHDLKELLFGAAAAQETRVATDLTSALGRAASAAEIRDAIIAGFRSALGVGFGSDVVASAEAAAAESLRAGFRL
jgi:lipoate-protein ligase A